MIAKLQSFLYFAYKASSSSTYFVFSRVTPLGGLLMFVLPIVVVIFLTYFKIATLSLLVVLVSIFVFSFLML